MITCAVGFDEIIWESNMRCWVAALNAEVEYFARITVVVTMKAATLDAGLRYTVSAPVHGYPIAISCSVI